MPITVKSHVGRDLLQSAQVFRRDPVVVWEYVANSLQYVETDVPPMIFVSLDERSREISVSDNGAGMSQEDLAHFFTMHGENRERRQGHIGRGMFGTGKAAAFGIADSLTVTSTRAGLRNSVRLTRTRIELAEGGVPIPLEELEVNVPTEEPNGTVILISGIHLKRLDREGIIRYVEQRLSTFPPDVRVYVDSHLCTFSEPEIVEEHDFPAEGKLMSIIGPVTLKLRVSKSPLEPELQGVQVFSHANWLATTLAGAERREMADYIFGTIEVPELEDNGHAIRPYDNTRSGDLNPNNPVVAAVYRHIGPAIDKVRRELVRRQRQREKSAEAQELAKTASDIADLLNEDFKEFQDQLRAAQSVARGTNTGSRSLSPLGGSDTHSSLVEGGEEPAELPDTGPDNEGTGRDGDGLPPQLPVPVVPTPGGQTTGRPSGGTERKRSPRGGFTVEYKELGAEQMRARYLPEQRAIYINLDHPQVTSGLVRAERNVTNPEFVRMSWEIAVHEYAIALAYERDRAGHYVALEQAIYDVRERVDSLTRRISQREQAST